MKWFPGNVDTAIKVSRKNCALLIVYIETDDEKGKQMGELWDKIDSQNIGCSTVGIKMRKGESDAKQFSEIYPTPILPATYLIDQNGKPIDVITHLIGLNLETLQAKINKSVQEFLKQSPESKLIPITTPPPSEESKISAEQEERLNMARILLEKKKQVEEERRLKDEEERKKIEQEKKKTEVKLEDSTKPLKQSLKPSKLPEKPVESGSQPTKEYTHCRVKVRFPNGSSYNDEFPVNDNLLSLLEVAQKKSGIIGPVELLNSYPRKTFSQEECEKTFKENGLVPDATLFLVAKPQVSYLPVPKIARLTSLISFLFLSPINFVFGLVMSFFNGNGSKKDDPPATQQPSQTRRMPQSAQIRRRGNIAGLHNSNEDDPEEQASWNGNSTQFM